MRASILLSLTALLLASCGGPDTEAVSKDEAAELGGGADVGRDYCEDFGWYGDMECDTFCQRPDPDCGVLRNVDGEGPSLCVGVRGNGPRITAHWSSLARIIEHYGLVDGISGGSSASITSFLLESVETNPHVVCDGCDAREQAARAAFLLKSLQGYIGEIAVSDEALAFQAIAEIYARVQEDGVEALLGGSDPTAGVTALQAILESDDLRALVNPEVLALLSGSDPVYHAQDMVAAIQAAANWEVSDPAMFVRPGLVSFPALAERVGRVGTFYAGWEPVDGVAMEQMLASCATPSRGMTWAEAAALPAGDTTCGALFSATLRDFRARFVVGDHASRVDEPVGEGVHALISTSVLTGAAVGQFEAAREQYLGAQPVTFAPSFDDVRFGYWGASADTARMLNNANGFNDGKTAKAMSLGQTSWREALSFSPAEPGLARALELPNGDVSAGGWSDLHPVLALRNMGCEQIVYLTRRGTNSGFAVGVAALLGRTDADHAAIFDAGNPDSGFALSIAEADGVWCTDWDTPPQTDLAAMETVGYDAPFEARSDFFLGEQRYQGAAASLGIAGCSAGVTD